MRCLLALFASACAFSQGVWERRADYPVLATEVSAAAIDGKAFAVCGLTPQGSISSLYIYDPKYDIWTQGAFGFVAGGGDKTPAEIAFSAYGVTLG